MLEPGTVLQNRYTIRDIIGRGGMGTVYLAEQIIFAGRKVAIKQMDPINDPAEAEKYAAQFLREAQLLGSLEHPGLVEVKDYFEEGGTLFLVMEYVEGDSLESLLRTRQELFPLETVVTWMGQVFDMLQYLHDHDPPVIFQDLKPANLMLSSQGRIRLIDFGIARTIDPTTRTVTLVRSAGTPGYAAPEQHGGLGGKVADIYSAGATMYALLTNTVPPPSLHLLLGSAELLELSTLNPQITPAVEGVVYTMMALLAANRYQSVAEARDALQRALLESRENQGTPRLRPTALRTGPAVPSGPPLAAGPPSSVGPPGFRIRRPSDGMLLSGPPSEPRTSAAPLGPELTVKRASRDPRRPDTPRPIQQRKCPGCGVLLEAGQICKRCLPEVKASVVVQPRPAPLPDPTMAVVEAGEGEDKRSLRGLFRRETGGLSGPSSLRPAIRRQGLDQDHLIQIVTCGEHIVFNSTEWLDLGEPLLFTLSVMRDHAATSHSSVPMVARSLVVTATRWTYTAEVLQEVKPDMLRYLKLFEGPHAPTEKRKEARVQCKFRVTSSELPHFQAMSTDMSPRGLGLLAGGPVEVGGSLTLRLDFDDDRFPHVVCRMQVRWCYYGPDGEYRIGTKLLDMSPEHAAIRRGYLDFVAQNKVRWST